MRIVIPHTALSVVDALRRCGYGFERRHDSGELSASRKVGGGEFPRFHIYANFLGENGASSDQGRTLQITLHIDQKAPTYRGSRAHSGEYAGPLIEEEAKRIEGIFAH